MDTIHRSQGYIGPLGESIRISCHSFWGGICMDRFKERADKLLDRCTDKQINAAFIILPI